MDHDYPSARTAPLLVAIARGFGGVDIRVRDTARYLDQKGLKYGVVALEGGPLHESLVSEGLNVIPMSIGRGDPRYIGRIANVAKEIAATVLDAHNMQSQYRSALAAPWLRVQGRLATVHSVYSDIHTMRGHRDLHEGALRLCKLCGFDFQSVSPIVSKYLVDFGIPGERLHPVLNGAAKLSSVPVPFVRSTLMQSRPQVKWPRL